MLKLITPIHIPVYESTILKSLNSWVSMAEQHKAAALQKNVAALLKFAKEQLSKLQH